jgi:hypothetical protein
VAHKAKIKNNINKINSIFKARFIKNHYFSGWYTFTESLNYK